MTSGGLPFDPSVHWQSSGRLRAAREAALGIARRLVAERDQPANPAATRQAFGEAHAGSFHLELAERDLRDVLVPLQERRFIALELGAGMAWMSALLAARAPRATFLATETGWSRASSPLSPANQKQFRLLCERDAPLRESFTGIDLHDPAAFRMPARLALANARAEALPLADATVDLLFSINCQEHIAGLEASWREAARVVAPGGFVYHTTEPLYFSPFGHHLRDIFPVPWGHLLWTGEELAALVEAEVGARYHWAPGVPLNATHLREEVFATLNGATPRALRRAIRSSGAWRVVGWLDQVDPRSAQWAREIGIAQAVRGIAREALYVDGVRMRLERVRRSPFFQAPLMLDVLTRRAVRRLIPR